MTPNTRNQSIHKSAVKSHKHM